ncbi:DUF853 family protein [Candidatus Woesearchaeota archaeon]|nr:DUF853 family protein [Candidatus Woesearchaeota archaeon]
MKKVLIGSKNRAAVSIPIEALKKHFIALGSSGSGKTVLCKVLVEEAAINGIPAILVDSQGDLASLALGSEKLNVKVTIFTPTSSKGIPICINPLKLSGHNLDKESIISIIHQISSSIAKLVGYNLNSDKGKGAQTAVYKILMESWRKKEELSSFSELADKILNLGEGQKKEILEYISATELKNLVKKIKYLTVGKKELLFQFGVPLDIESLLADKKTKINIIYLNTLENQADKEFFVSMLATNIYQWMLGHPSSELQALFYIDEIAPYLPAGAQKPLSKPILTLLFKQARKYGLGCIVSTQNPGDIDYKAFAQFGTWAVGRLTTKQDRAKIKDALKSLAGPQIEKVTNKLPKLKPGEFFIFSPDYFDDLVNAKVRRLYTEHKTLSERDIKTVTDKIRHEFNSKIIEIRTRKQQGITVQEKQGQEMHLPVNIDFQKISKIAEKKRKKWLFFGKPLEQVESLDLIFEPMLKTKVKVREKKLFKSEINEYDVIFNSYNAEPLVFKGMKFIQLNGAKHLLELTDSQTAVLKPLLNKKQTTAGEIAIKLKTSSNSVNKTLKDLLKKGLVSYEKSKSFQWFSLVRINMPDYVKKVSTFNIELNSNKVDDVKIEKPAVDLKKLSNFVRSWFKAEVVNVEFIYYPVYKIRYSGKKSAREIYVSAVNGKIFKHFKD